MSSDRSSFEGSSRQHIPETVLNLILAAVGLVSAMMIHAAANGDLWLDEIWSIFFAESAKSPWEIVSLYRHDNNHLLNTLYLYAIGKQDTLIFYRFFSVAAGIGSLYLLTRIARKRGDIESIFVLLLAGFSYPLILYFSEARGYGPAMLFGLLSLYLLGECQANFSKTRLLFFWLSACLGLLSHLSFAIVFLSLSLVVIYREIFGPASPRSKILNCFKYLFLPFLFLGLLYVYFARGITIGGGDINNPFTEISRGTAYLLGLPQGSTPWRIAALGLFTAIALAGSHLYQRNRDRSWPFFIAILVLPPAVIIIFTRPTLYYFRYLVVTFPFFYLVLSSLLGGLYRKGSKYSYVVLIILCVYLIGQAQYLLPLITEGRGNYRAILREISEKSGGNILKVGSDHDFRNKMLLSFYQRFLPSHQTLQYIEQSGWNVEPPDWVILHGTDPSFEPHPFIGIDNQRFYRLTRTERFSGNSGFSWFLYHRAAPGITSQGASQIR
jgi:hypothetical protein